MSYMSTLPSPPRPITSEPILLRDWPHGPIHRLSWPGTYIVTAAIYQKLNLFNTSLLLTRMTNLFLNLAETHAVTLEAGAIFSNHYHFVAEFPATPHSAAFYS